MTNETNSALNSRSESADDSAKRRRQRHQKDNKNVDGIERRRHEMRKSWIHSFDASSSLQHICDQHVREHA